MSNTQRLQKIIAESGLTSRREAEIWIDQGRVKVNGKVVTKLGSKANPEKDTILVNNRKLKLSPKKVYYLFNKPRNVLVTANDPQERPTIYDYLKKIEERLFPVGRLDFESEGLLLLTNDGELANKWMHPSSKVPKVYEVKVNKTPLQKDLDRLVKGIPLEEGLAKVVSVKIFKKNADSCWLAITLTEGKNRQIRRMLEKLSLRIQRLRRVSIGTLKLKNLRTGYFRQLHSLGDFHRR